ncbi:MAG: hypothetical protein ABSD44_00450 [Terracidiphilus sp.]
MRSLMLALFLISVDASAQITPTPAAIELRASVMPMDQRKALAAPLLQAAEKQAATLDDVDRAIVLYRIAGGWMPLDRERSSALYRQAFLASLHADGAFRPALEHMILNEALPLAPTVVLEVAPQADKETQQKVYGAILTFALQNTNTRLAAQALQAAADHQAISGSLAATVLASFPVEERAQAFRTITTFYNLHPPSIGSWDFSGLVSQFYTSLPPQDVLAAIDIILKRAMDVDSDHSGRQVGMSSGPNNIGFSKETDLQLFAVAPALQKLDPARATKLLQESPETAKWLIKYPNGVESFDQNHSFHYGGVAVQPFKAVPSDLRTFGVGNAALLQEDEGLEFTRSDFPYYLQPSGSGLFEQFTDHKSPEYAAYRAVVSAHQPDVVAAVASVPEMRKVPTSCSGDGDWCYETYPQANLVRSLAEDWTYGSQEEDARAALKALPTVLEKIPAQQRCAPLADAADFYLRLGDRSAANGAVQTGLDAAARAVAQEDATYHKPFSQLLRSSTNCYQRLISAGVNAEYDSLYKAVDSLQHSALRAFATAMLARGLLGVPLRRNLVVNANGSYCLFVGQASYCGGLP